MSKKTKQMRRHIALFDPWFVFAVCCLFAIGLVMVTSASMAMADRQYHDAFHFAVRQAIYLGLGLLFAAVILRIESWFWQKTGGFWLLASLGALFLVLIPGIGHQINGSMRWIGIGPLGMQVSELAKLGMIIYLAGYLVRRHEEVQTQISGFLKPMALLGLVGGLLLLEPDFGATVVITATALGMLFLAGVQLRQFIFLLLLVVAALALLAVSAPYRMQRLTSFLNPWANQFDSGYQLTQSLIAFGRGGWSGVGLGNGIQKLFYLPEPHTDFLFAVLAEELGLIGVMVVITLYVILVGRALWIGYQAQKIEEYFAAYLAYGLGLWLGMQAMINMGVNAGVLPTKGLTLPLLSYGGSSLLIMCIVLALLLRIDHEVRILKRGRF
ncbi:MAG: ftsW [Gammaproteobacteria bacterium]|jgi:cell division protein FtsW|nr:ftsW [Gammaproteobacteria bacterium]